MSETIAGKRFRRTPQLLSVAAMLRPKRNVIVFRGEGGVQNRRTRRTERTRRNRLRDRKNFFGGGRGLRTTDRKG
jgi:hypothetical protein